MIPQAVIVSLEGDKKDENSSKFKKIVYLSIAALALVVISVFLLSSPTSKHVEQINIDGVRFEKKYIDIRLPVAEAYTYDAEESRNLVRKATNLIKKDDFPSYKKSVQLLLGAFEVDSENNSILSYLAYSYARLYRASRKDNEYINALRSIINRSEKIDPNIQTLFMAKIAFLNIQEKYSEAIAEFNELMGWLKDPGNINHYVLLPTAISAMGSNDYNSAYQIVTRINESKDESPLSHYLEGVIRINNKELELAASSFEKAIKLNPNHHSSRVKLFELGKNASVGNIFNFIRNNYEKMFHDDVSTCLFLIGNLLVQNNETEKAKHFYRRALDFYPYNARAMITYEQLGGDVSVYRKDILPSYAPSVETATFMLRGDQLFNLQQYRDASLQYRMATSLDPKNPSTWYKLAEAYRLSYEYARAIEAYQEAIKLDRMNVGALVKLARVQTDIFKFKDAHENIQKARRIDPHNPNVLFTLGYLQDKRGAGDAEVMKYYHRAIANDFSHVEANFHIGVKTFDYGRYQEARLSFEKVLSKEPDHFESYMYITRIISKLDYINRAERYVENLKKKFPNVAEIYTGLALAYKDMANYSMAEKLLKKALSKNRYSIQTLSVYARLSEILGRHKDALGYYETISIIAPYKLEAINRRVNIFHQLGQQANTERELKRLLRLAPEYPYANYTLGKLYYENSQYASAEIALKNEIKHNPYIRDSYLLLGDVYIKQNKTDEAIDLFQKMLRVDRLDPYAFLGLAMASYAAKDFSSAVSYVTQARHIDSSIDRIYLLECKLFFNLKNYPEAKNACEEYIRRSPSDYDTPKARDILSRIQ